MSSLQVFELRDYTLHPGQREVLIDLFEREFIESQEVLGSHVLATFRDLDRAEHFVWIRGFADFAARYEALNGFYTSPLWQAQRNAANATIVDSDNVLLLAPVSGSLERDPASRPPPGARPGAASLIVASSYFPKPGGEDAFAAFHAEAAAPLLRDCGGTLLASFKTERRPNNYPRLPVRENETVFVAFTRFASAEAHGAPKAPALEAAQRRLEDEIAARTIAPSTTMRLAPTARSALR